MAMKYVKVYYDWLEMMEALSDGERGRLITAALEYARSGIVPSLSGSERFVFPSIRAQIDRDAQSYSEISEKRKSSGSKGGLAKATKCKQNVAKGSKTYQDKDKDKDKDKDNDDYRRQRAGAREGDDGLSGDEKEILDYCHDLIGPFTPAQDKKILAAAAGMSPDSAINAICIAYEKGAHTPDYVIATLATQKENPNRKPGN